MNPADLHASLSENYKTYNEVIKPLIAEIEARFEEFPLPLFNEIRAFNDHVAQCYTNGVTNDRIKVEINKADAHLKRIIFDCFKYLNVALSDKIKQFEKQTRNIDLTIIDNGLFYPKYRQLSKSAIDKVREARKKESKDNDSALTKYQEAYNTYCDLENLIENSTQDVKWARAKHLIRKTLKFLLG